MSRVWKYYFSIQSFLLIFAIAVASYFNINLWSSFFFPPIDGWCIASREGIGVHCFSDLNIGLKPSNVDPYFITDKTLWLSPADKYISKVTTFLSLWTSERITLGLCFTIYFLILILAFFKWVRLSNQPNHFIFVMLASAPVVTILDRLNNICLTLPFFVLWLRDSKSDSRRSILWLSILGVIKPQFLILLTFEILNRRGWKSILLPTIPLISLYIAVTLHDRMNYRVFLNWTNELSNYSLNHQSLQVGIPQNLSFAKYLKFIGELFGNVSDVEFSYLSQLLAVVLFVLLLCFWMRLTFEFKVFVCIFLSFFMLSQVVYSYYLILLVIPLFKLSWNGRIQDLEFSNSPRKNIYCSLEDLLLLAMMSFCPIYQLDLFQNNNYLKQNLEVPIINFAIIHTLISLFIAVSFMRSVLDRNKRLSS